MSFYTDPWLYNCAANPADSPEEQAEQKTIIEATQRAVRFARTQRRHAGVGRSATRTPTSATRPSTPPARTSRPAPSTRGRSTTRCLDVPTEADGVISVSAVGPSGKKADYSNYGIEQTDFSAPGGFFRDFIDDPGQNRVPENLDPRRPTRRTWPSPRASSTRSRASPIDAVRHRRTARATATSCTYWQYLQGTSMASPHAAGVAALVVSAHGHRDTVHGGLTMDPEEVERIMRETAPRRPRARP